MTPQDEIDKLRESLRLTQAELAKVRYQYEELAEEQASVDEARQRARWLAEAAAEGLGQITGASTGLRGWVKRRLLRYLPNDAETAEIAEIEASALFDPAWYLLSYPEAAATGLAPVLHYLRHGAERNLDPGPSFSTRAYREAHPQLGATNPLLDHLRAGRDAR